MRIIFYGLNAARFRPAVEEACSGPLEVTQLADDDRSPMALAAFARARAIVGSQWRAPAIEVRELELFHIPAAGYDSVDVELLPRRAAVCNCFGHEPPIAEYVLLTALRHVHPLDAADRLLRTGEWSWSWYNASEPRGELRGRTIGLLGFGHIGREVARKARGFDLHIVACNRSPVPTGDLVDEYLPMGDRQRFFSMCDIVVVGLPLLPETQGIVDAAALGAMRPDALLINVARGPVIDEAALFDALRERRIGGAAIDTWYRYPEGEEGRTLPATLPFHELDNVLMTPHLSGWTTGTIARRAVTMARNLERLARGEPLENVVRQPTA